MVWRCSAVSPGVSFQAVCKPPTFKLNSRRTTVRLFLQFVKPIVSISHPYIMHLSNPSTFAKNTFNCTLRGHKHGNAHQTQQWAFKKPAKKKATKKNKKKRTFVLSHKKTPVLGVKLLVLFVSDEPIVTGDAGVALFAPNGQANPLGRTWSKAVNPATVRDLCVCVLCVLCVICLFLCFF
jgi:hypothetical protein